MATRPKIGLSDCTIVTVSSRPQDIELMGTTVLTHWECGNAKCAVSYLRISPLPAYILHTRLDTGVARLSAVIGSSEAYGPLRKNAQPSFSWCRTSEPSLRTISQRSVLTR